ncbi:ABC transporter substrate-binding protein, partial [Halobium palmae]
LLAGCSSDGGSESTTSGDADPSTAAPTTATTTAGAETDAEAETTEATETTGDAGYSVTMSPMGEVQFPSVPQSVYAGQPNTADMAIAAGKGDAINSMYYPQYNGTLMKRFYERLDGVSFDLDGLTDSWNVGKEGFYELDSDVHLTDPAYASTLENLDEDDVEEIGTRIAPWFGNYYSGSHGAPPDPWADGYEYYTLWEIFDRVAQVFDAGERADALTEVHSSMLSTIESKLPPEEERPSVALTFEGEGDTLWVYRLNADGFLAAHTRPLGATDAFADLEFDGPQKQIDYEALLEADPDVILVLFTLAGSYDISEIRSGLEGNDVASEVSAVKNDRVYAQGARYQGPLMNLFQLEMTAKEIYPDQFGEWPGYEGGPYPDIPQEERLFDRGAVSDAVNGNG